MSSLSTEDKNRLIHNLRSSIYTALAAADKLSEAEPDFKQLQEIKAHLIECVELGQQRPTRSQRPAPVDAPVFTTLTADPENS